MKHNTVRWEFPLPRTHTGIMLGNATTGLLIWGEGSELKITVGRADLWDHRGGMEWTERQNYYDLKKNLEAGDFEAIKEMFAPKETRIAEHPNCNRPSITPLGRLDLSLGDGAELKEGKLDIPTGLAEVVYTKGSSERKIGFRIAMEEQIFTIELPSNENVEIKPIPSWTINPDLFKRLLFEPPTFLEQENINGWLQKSPNDPAVALAYRRNDNTVFVTIARTDDIDVLRESLAVAVEKGKQAIEQENIRWWKRFWDKVPQIKIPNEKLYFLYHYGLYKFACFTSPTGVPATLQGPWIEEYDLPPWSSDYHFNINVQMCYWPAYKANCLEHLRPMFEMVWSWRDKLRANAKAFLGIDDGFILPHAVDDQGTCMGGFWTGTVDQGCAAWIGQMMFSYYKYTGDVDFLRDIAYPFMKGALRVYEAMLEKRDDEYYLPVSVSPEYRGSQLDAWGANASFQLSAIHRLCEDLLEASDILGQKPADIWLELSRKLPKATLIGEANEKRIALWEGTDLEESHRHHSYLAGICPFDTIDIYSEQWIDIIENTISHWIKMGMGLWSGWCIPWASMIHSRLNNGEMAELLLEIWERVFTNEGYGTLHDCMFPGFSLMGAPAILKKSNWTERMQMDAAMGAVTAIQDMLMHTRRGVVYIFAGVPKRWKDVAFTDMPTEGGFLVSSEKENGQILSVSIKATRDGQLKLGNPWPNQQVEISFSDGRKEMSNADVLAIELKGNEQCTIKRKGE